LSIIHVYFKAAAMATSGNSFLLNNVIGFVKDIVLHDESTAVRGATGLVPESDIEPRSAPVFQRLKGAV
jgi:hypothetical protein